MADQTKIRLGGLWENESRSGEKFLSGRLGGGKLLVFENKHRRNDRDPSHVLYIVPGPERAEDGDDRQDSNSGSARGTRRADPLPSDAPGTERFEIQPGECDSDGIEVPF